MASSRSASPSTHLAPRVDFSKLAGTSLLYGVLVLGASFAILPFLFMIANALKTYAETSTRVSALPFDPKFWPRVPQWENFRIAWQRESLGRYFINSLVISLVTLAGVYITSTLAAYAFAKLYFVGKNVIFSVMLATLMIPETVLLIPNFIIVASLKWIDKLPALTVPFIAGAFHIFLLRQFFNQIPNALIESARLDGCSHPRILVSIVVPLSRAPLFTVGFLAFLHAWNSLQWPLVVTQTPRWRPISVGLVKFITEAGPETQLRLAGAIIALVPIMLIYFLAQKQITEAITRTGLKG
jgi:ABC-type glycerol-3-phosphate transport system permease component